MKLSLALGHGFRFLLGLGLASAGGLCAQDVAANGQLNPQQVDQLMGPIALYPDALVAIILPASTVPGDVVLAARFVANGGDPDQIDNQPWNESVKALAHYPTLVKWMDENLSWTQELGGAFLNQPDDVMTSVQRLRVRAKATGALTSTAQQKLVLDGDDIEIVPAQPDVIYVPYYDPDVVYVMQQPGYYYGGPYLTFGLGLPIGFWLSYDFNWRTRVIVVGDRNHNWSEHRDWNRHPSPSGNNGSWHAWKPPVTRPPFSRPDPRRPFTGVVHPNPVPGAPAFPHDSRRNDNHPQPNTNARDADRNHPPVPVNNPDVRPDNRDHRPPTPPRPEITVSPNNPPHPTGPSHQPPPTPTNNSSGRDDSRDNHDRRPAAEPTGPRPDMSNPPSANPPRPQFQPADQPPRVQPTRPDPRPANVAPPHQSNPQPAQPPPAPRERDSKDKDNDVAR